MDVIKEILCAVIGYEGSCLLNHVNYL